LTIEQSTFFVQKGSTFWAESDLNSKVFPKLPAGNYTVGITQTGQYFLDKVEDFAKPGKVYGDSKTMAERAISTFHARSKNLGLLLAGEKGSGKTMLTRLISQSLAEVGVPTIIITSPLCGDSFFKFLYSISQECIVLFDEFEKVYSDTDDQQKMLTLLDGVFPSKKLFLLTCNDRWKLDSHMRNRPGRLHYMVEFNGLGAEFVREYCQDALKNQGHTEDVVSACMLFRAMNFDMLQAIVWEMNQYNEPVGEAMKMLNARPDGETEREVFDVKIKVKDVDFVFEGDHLYTRAYVENPLKMQKDTRFDIHVGSVVDDIKGYLGMNPSVIGILSKYIENGDIDGAYDSLAGLDSTRVESKTPKKSLLPDGSIPVTVSLDNLTSVDKKTGAYIFRSKEGHLVSLSRQKRAEFDMSRFSGKYDDSVF
jgi:ATPase family associated with various cellular activities (AAA)